MHDTKILIKEETENGGTKRRLEHIATKEEQTLDLLPHMSPNLEQASMICVMWPIHEAIDRAMRRCLHDLGQRWLRKHRDHDSTRTIAEPWAMHARLELFASLHAANTYIRCKKHDTEWPSMKKSKLQGRVPSLSSSRD